ncbi:MAG: DUF1707 domain-containing protein [Corynebacterium sp.]|nr:DUF1707 domain-containing protein [Corynebacterium sp.]
MIQSFITDYRISDTDRQQAMDNLSNHFAAGRLNVTEYDARLAAIADAQMKSELTHVFGDLPTTMKAPVAVAPPTVDGDALAAYKYGRNMRIGVVMLTFLGAPLFGVLSLQFLSGVMPIMAIILFVLLFVMKLGPKSWHQPDPRKAPRRY